MASSFCVHFKNALDTFFLKEEFEITAYCSSKYNDKNTNIISRIQNSLVTAINSTKHLLQFLVIVLDGDLIEYLGYHNEGQAAMYGSWCEWLVNCVKDGINERYKALAQKARDKNLPFTYWVQLPVNCSWEQYIIDSHNKFNLALESILKSTDHMCMLKLKEIWDAKDDRLVKNNSISHIGYAKYWLSIDAAFKFNYNNRLEFLACEASRNLLTKKPSPETQHDKKTDVKGDVTPKSLRDMVQNMFDRRHEYDSMRKRDRFHWSREPMSEDHRRERRSRDTSPRFWLPRLHIR